MVVRAFDSSRSCGLACCHDHLLMKHIQFVSQNFSSLITISVRKWAYVELQIYEVQGKKGENFRSVPENGHSEVLQSQTLKSRE